VLAAVLIIVGTRLALNIPLHGTPDVARIGIEHPH
jgi:hypothetical protein